MTPEQCETVYRHLAMGVPVLSVDKFERPLVQRINGHDIASSYQNAKARWNVTSVSIQKSTESYSTGHLIVAHRRLYNMWSDEPPLVARYMARLEFKTITETEDTENRDGIVAVHGTLRGVVNFAHEQEQFDRTIYEPWSEGNALPEDRLVDILIGGTQ